MSVGLAMALDGNGRWAYLDPKLGAMHAVAEAARKVAMTGATAGGGDELSELRQSREAGDHGAAFAAIDGIAEACTALGTPITGGNVSLYNETKGEGIYPTPVLGIVGILDDVTKAVPAEFQKSRRRDSAAVAGAARGEQPDPNLKVPFAPAAHRSYIEPSSRPSRPMSLSVRKRRVAGCADQSAVRGIDELRFIGVREGCAERDVGETT